MPKQPPLILSVLSLLVFQNWPGKGGGVIYAQKEILQKVEKDIGPINIYSTYLEGSLVNKRDSLALTLVGPQDRY